MKTNEVLCSFLKSKAEKNNRLEPKKTGERDRRLTQIQRAVLYFSDSFFFLEIIHDADKPHRGGFSVAANAPGQVDQNCQLQKKGIKGRRITEKKLPVRRSRRLVSNGKRLAPQVCQVPAILHTRVPARTIGAYLPQITPAPLNLREAATREPLPGIVLFELIRVRKGRRL